MKTLPLKRLLNQISFFGGANVINIVLPVILIPILALAFIPSDYRVLSMFQMLIALFSIFIGLQSQSSVLRYVKNDERDFKADQRMIGSTFFIFSRSFFVLFILIFLIQNIISDFLKLNNLVVWLAFIAANLYFFWNLFLNYSQAKENGRAYFISTCIHASASLSLTVVFISFGFDFNERIIAIVLSAALIGIISRAKFGFKNIIWNDESIKKNLTYALGLIPHALFVFMLAYIDKIYVNTFSSDSTAGSYFLMFQVSQICLLVPTSLNKIFVPWIFNNGSDSVKIKKLFKIKNIFISALLIFLVCSLTAIFGYIALLLIGGKNSYEIIGSIFILLSLVAILDSFYLFSVTLLHFLEETKTISLITLISVICTIIMLGLTGPTFGVTGAALSCLFGSLIRLMLSFAIGMRGFKKYHFNKNGVKL